MFGLGKNPKNNPSDDSLPILVEVIQNTATFELAKKVWDVNSRYLRPAPANGKEFLHFGLVDAPQAVWLERDKGRTDALELIVTWWEGKIRFADIYAITNTGISGVSGDDAYAKQVLNALLTTAATLPVDRPKNG